MANQEHVDILKQGAETWNQWRKKHPEVKIDLFGANLSKANLCKINLEGISLRHANFNGSILWEANFNWSHLPDADFRNALLDRANFRWAYLNGANLSEASLRQANLRETNFVNANLHGADLSHADLRKADFSIANLSETDMEAANLEDTNLRGANFQEANLKRAMLIGANLSEANLNHADLRDCHVYALAAWDVELIGTKQTNLVITHPYKFRDPVITVDNLEVAQFIYLLLNNAKLRQVIDTITSKAVLILGRFTPQRKEILDAIREELRQHDKLPIIFDFERPTNRDFTETVRTLAHIAQFVIADLTDHSSIPQELQTILPDLEIPVLPIIEMGKKPHSMFPDFGKHPWVFPVYRYKDQASLIASLKDEIIEPAEKKARQLAIEKAKRLEKP